MKTIIYYLNACCMSKLCFLITFLVATTLHSQAQYCVPSYTTACSLGDYIDGFKLGSIQNTASGCTNVDTAGYTNYSSASFTTSLVLNQGYTAVAHNNPTYVQGYALWIDWNQDEDFDDAGEYVAPLASLTNAGDSATFNFIVPSGAVLGETRMRVRCVYNTILDSTNYCNLYQYGETEDYTVNVISAAPMSYSSSNATQVNFSNAFQGTTNQEILRVEIITTGNLSPITVNGFVFNTNGSDDTTNDVTNYRLLKGNTFSSAVLLAQSNVLADLATITPETLATGNNIFWLAYDIAPTATAGNVIDAECTQIILSSGNEVPTVTAPAGNRTIVSPMTISNIVTTQNTNDITSAPALTQQVIGIEIEASVTGSPIDVLQFSFDVQGTTNTADISNARLWYTGNNNTFIDTALYGNFVTPNTSFAISGNKTLLSGTNYFWLTFDIVSGATLGNLIDAQCNEVIVTTDTITPSVTDPAGNRRIFFYCTSSASSSSDTKIDTVIINNTVFGSDTITCESYTDHTATPITVQQEVPFNLRVRNGSCSRYHFGSYTRAWIDYNQNGSFENDEIVFTNGNSVSSGFSNQDTTIIVPHTTSLGQTRMRIIVRESSIPSACGNYSWGETEDYLLNIQPAPPMQFDTLIVTQPTLTEVAVGATKQSILKIEIVTEGYSNPIEVEGFNFNTNGSSDANNDITQFRLYKGNDFGTAQQVAMSGLLSDFSNSTNFSSPIFLENGNNVFWLAYDISASATTNNVVDAELTSVALSSGNEIPTVIAPAGDRLINTPMTFITSYAIQPDTSNITSVPSSNQLIIGVVVEMSATGAALNLESLNFTTNGSTNPSGDIANAKVWFTGAVDTFNTTAQYGTTFINPLGSFTIPQILPLQNGKNHFWLTYDVSSSANSGNFLDAECNLVAINGNNEMPTITDPSGARKILNYCSSFADEIDDYRIDSVFINGTKFGTDLSVCETYTDNMSTAIGIERGSTFNLTIKTGTCDPIMDYNARVRAWIDYNQNGTFELEEEILDRLIGGLPNNYELNFSPNIPSDATLGNTRMRIVLDGRGFEMIGTLFAPACGYYRFGETEDFTINILPGSPMSYISTDVTHPNLSDVAQGQTNQSILRVDVQTTGSENPLIVNGFTFNTNGSTDTLSDVTNYILRKGNSFENSFIIAQSNSLSDFINLSIPDTLSYGTNTYWLSYDISPTATINNLLDAQLLNIHFSIGDEVPNTIAPAGARMINNYMTFNNLISTQNTDTITVVPAIDQQIIGFQINMTTGVSVNLTQLRMSWLSSTSVNDIENIKIWYTGNIGSFATTQQVGQTQDPTSDTLLVEGTLALLAGINYFWITYDVPITANNGNELDAYLVDFVINGDTIAAGGAGNPAGNRFLKFYCASLANSSGDSRIDRVRFNTIDFSVTTPTCRSYTNATNVVTNVIVGNNYDLIVTGGTCHRQYDRHYRVYFDWNNDGDFDDTDEDYLGPSPAIGPLSDTGDFATLNITIPLAANIGSTRMRIVLSEDDIISACGTYGWGETQDFTINILNTPAQPVAVTNLMTFAGNEKVKLVWQKSNELDVNKYRIYRNLTNSFATATLIDSTLSLTDTTFTDLSVTNDVLYFYWVTALNIGNVESDSSLRRSAVPRIEAGKAVEITAINQKISITGSSDFDFDTQITISLWFKTNQLVGQHSILSRSDATGLPTENIYIMAVLNARPYVFVRLGNGGSSFLFTGTDTVADGKWHHYVLVRNATNLTAYIDGKLIGTTVLPNSVHPIPASNPLLINRDNFLGEIDEVAFFKKALSPSEVIAIRDKPLIGNEDSLVGLWHFDEPTGSIAYDNSRFQRDGLHLNNPNVVVSKAMHPFVSTLNVTSNCNSNSANLIWNKNKALDTKKYVVYEGANPITLVPVDTVLGRSDTTTTLNSLLSQDYYIAIEPVDSAGQAGEKAIFNIQPTLDTTLTQNKLAYCVNDSVVMSVVAGSNYQWHYNNTPISGAVNATFAAQEAGNYYVVINASVCQDTSRTVILGDSSRRISVRTFLQGAYNMTNNLMNDSLRVKGELSMYLSNNATPLSFLPNTPTYKSSLTAVPNDAVDVIALVVRQSNAPFSRIDTAFAWLLRNGEIIDYETGSYNYARVGCNVATGSYHIQAQHRNHLEVMSATPIAIAVNGSTLYDLSVINNVYGAGTVPVDASPLRYGMIGGNVFYDNITNASDAYKVNSEQILLLEGYEQSDANLDGKVNALDFERVMRSNNYLYFSTGP